MIRENICPPVVEPALVIEQDAVQPYANTYRPQHAYQPEPINGNMDRQGGAIPPVTYEGHAIMVGRVPVIPVIAHRRFSNPTLYAQEDLAPAAGRVYEHLAEHPVVTEVVDPTVAKPGRHAVVTKHVASPVSEVVLDEHEIIEKLGLTIGRLEEEKGVGDVFVSTGRGILNDLRKGPDARNRHNPLFEANRHNRLKDALGLLSALQSVS